MSALDTAIERTTNAKPHKSAGSAKSDDKHLQKFTETLEDYDKHLQTFTETVKSDDKHLQTFTETVKSDDKHLQTFTETVKPVEEKNSQKFTETVKPVEEKKLKKTRKPLTEEEKTRRAEQLKIAREQKRLNALANKAHNKSAAAAKKQDENYRVSLKTLEARSAKQFSLKHMDELRQQIEEIEDKQNFLFLKRQ
jgi:hypothetical protein